MGYNVGEAGASSACDYSRIESCREKENPKINPMKEKGYLEEDNEL